MILALLALIYLFVIPIGHRTLFHNMGLLEPYALSPFATPVSLFLGYDPVRFEILFDGLFLGGFLILLLLHFILIRKLQDITLQLMMIFGFSIGIYTICNVLSHSFAA